MIQITVYKSKRGTQWDVVRTDSHGIPLCRTSSNPDESGNATKALLEAINQAAKMIDSRYEK